MKIKISALLFGITYLMCSCGGDKKAKILRVSPPVANVEVGKNVFTIDPTRDTLLQVESGSTIFIPANSLIGADKKPVKGETKVSYEEYMNQADIILSGIPMQYDSAGESYFFESAGMFTIDAETPEGEKLGIANGKAVTVSQLSPWKDQTTGFNFYQFDTVAGKWRYLTTQAAEPAAPEPVVVAEEASADVKIAKSVRTVDDFVFDINVNFSMYSELTDMKDIMWKYSGNRKYKDPEKEQWIFDRNWPDTKIVRDESQEGAYIITLKSTKEAFSTSVVPVSVDPATEGNVDVVAGKSVEKLGAQTAQLIENAEVYRRTMQLNTFGTCNWDMILRLLMPKKVKIKFLADGGELPDGYRVYQVFTNNNAVVECLIENKKTVSLIPEASQEFIYVAVNPTGDALVCRNTSSIYESGDDETVDCQLVKSSRRVECRKDLLDIILEV